jgi:acyl carrier protein
MSPTEDNICNALVAHLTGHVLAEGVAVDASTDLPSLDVDSVTIVELAMHIEERFVLEVPMQFLTSENTRTVADLARTVIAHGRPLK